VRGGQAFCELLEIRRETVVGLITGRPESIAPGILWLFDNLEDGVVGRNTLESDTNKM
jgi:hypothetical protein